MEALAGATAMRGSRLLAGAVLCRLVQAQLLSSTQLSELLHRKPLDAITAVLATPGWEAAGAAALPKPSAVRALTPFYLLAPKAASPRGQILPKAKRWSRVKSL